ncbi:hypothetical protein [Actinocrispum wychmicini]|uniref:Uncharacterized protein n=1 Tax=Actinocrispum wychmicini TaxID=1213861 RepID=A0A4R2JSG6_9PSEU|nr:hypothetical protein [Actinocrispum wychmicini]TCO57115.1 hypothetical protein EV192_106592 [Actinocrispum wychmicini]
MGVPSPAIPSFVDGTVVHQGDLNALASNLTNLYAYNQAGFYTQRPSVLINTTSGQSVPNVTHTILNFQAAIINTDNMWTVAVPNQVTIQHAGIYWCFGQIRWPVSAANLIQSDILVNGTSIPANIAVTSTLPAVNGSAGGHHVAWMANLAVGATLFLDGYQNSGGAVTLDTFVGGSTFGAFFVTNST